MKKLHSLLIRQLKKHLKLADAIPPEWNDFVTAVNEAYQAFDNDRKLLEQSLDLSSKEMTQINQELRANEQTLRNMVEDLRKVNEDLKQAQLQLLQSEKMASIGQLAAGIAHEINNPVGFISNNIEILQEYIQNYTKILMVVDDLKKHIEEKKITKAVATMNELKKLEEELNLDYIRSDMNGLLGQSRQGLERIKKIVVDLRTFAREDRAEAMEPVKVEEIMDSILSIVDNELKYKAELVKNYGDTPPVQCNPQRIGQVFINLLMNAAQAMEERGRITIRTYLDGKFVGIDITDTGKGIPAEHIAKIFDPFFTTKPVGQGTGLGLSVSHEIIKKHNGEIKVKSTVGKGTTFTIKLPAANNSQ